MTSCGGSTVLSGAADTILLLKREGDLVTVKCEKQKEAAEFEPFTLRLTPTGESCILTDADPQSASALSKLQSATLQCLADISTSEGCSTTQWMRSSTERGAMAERSFYTAKNALLAKGYAIAVRGSRRYAVSPEGMEVLQLQGYCKLAANAPRDHAAAAAAPLVRGSACSPAAVNGIPA